MTTWVVLNLLKKYNIDERKEFVDISPNASETQGTTAELAAGDRLNVWDLLHGVMLPSGNDAAMALAEHFGNKLLISREIERKQEEESRRQSLTQDPTKPPNSAKSTMPPIFKPRRNIFISRNS